MDYFRQLPASGQLAVVTSLVLALAVLSAPPAEAGPGGVTVAPGFTLTAVHDFPQALGQTPKYLGLSRDGNLYGTTYYGGSNGDGNAYRLSPSGTFTNLVSCTLKNCLYPIGLTAGADGNVYGISEGDSQGFQNNGQLFAVTPKFKTEVNFNDTPANTPWNLELGRNSRPPGRSASWPRSTARTAPIRMN